MYRCYVDENTSDFRWIAAKSLDEARKQAQELFKQVRVESIHVEQDQDVLDTWFSSGLLPISLFYHTKEKKEFPTTLLETGYDIMFFWVARMVMLVNCLIFFFV